MKHAVWGTNVPDDGNGKSLARWEFRKGTTSVEVPSLYEFQGDTSIYAVLDSKESLKFTVKFLSYNDTILQEFKDVAYGTLPEYSGASTYRDSTGLKYRYTFKGWTPAITEVFYDQVYKAVYDSSLKWYRVDYEARCAGRWTHSYQDVVYGEKSSLCKRFYGSSCSDSLYEYVYKGMSVDCDSFVVLSDTTVYAVFDTVPLPSSSSEKISSSSSGNVESSSSTEKKSSSSKSDAIQLSLASVSLKYTVERGWIHFSGLTFAEPVSLFDVQGNLVKREISTENNLSIALERRGMYILRYMGTSYRVFVP